MKEIGGYLEYEYNTGSLYHDDAIRLNCGRVCLEYVIRAYEIKRIWLPFYLCDTVEERCLKLGVDVAGYHLNEDFSIDLPKIQNDEWLYLVNYYGQLDKSYIKSIVLSGVRVICDYSQSYFEIPIENVPTLYTCRKYFGVPDGGFLYVPVSKVLKETIGVDNSTYRMSHIFGRMEESASRYYNEYKINEENFSKMPLKYMSKITENMLRGIDYSKVKKTRERNWKFLHTYLRDINGIELKDTDGPYAYPLYLTEAKRIREKLIENKIYVPVIWPNVIMSCTENSVEYRFAQNILPLPCDQRYAEEDMRFIVEQILKEI